jgi:iron-sulfur cluster insertion protein
MEQVYNPRTIFLTNKAVAKVQKLVSEEEGKSLNLRVYITGGGCNGFQYGFTFDEKVNDDDVVIEQNCIKLIVDDLSYQYLVGGEIDHQQDLRGSKFLINNPNAASTCSCGNSFSV